MRFPWNNGKQTEKNSTLENDLALSYKRMSSASSDVLYVKDTWIKFEPTHV